jgi:hypothetical protein
MGKATTQSRDRLQDLTRQVFEPRAERRLTDEDVREIGENLVGFVRVLAKWAKAERQHVSSDPNTAQLTDKILNRNGQERDLAE